LKEKRQAYIRKIVQTHAVETQEMLVLLLEEAGIPTSQVTVSRDIKELRLHKTLDEENRLCYRLPYDETDKQREFALLRNGIISAEASGVMLCVRTETGLAQGVCAVLDRLQLPETVGSIAGDDTIFLLCKSATAAAALRERVNDYATDTAN
jgi:transcriptional regulator of arginine metabolism